MDLATRSGWCLHSQVCLYPIAITPCRRNIPYLSIIWATHAPSNVRFFVWRSLLDRLPTRGNLWKRRVLTAAEDACCPRCLYDEESNDHALIKCPATSEAWALCYRLLGLVTVQPGGVKEHLQQHWFLSLSAKQSVLFRVIWFALAWSICLHRNQMVFNEGIVEVRSSMEIAQVRAWNWLSGKVHGFNYSV